MNLSSYFAGKKITVLGLGLLGRAVGDAEFLAEQGAELIVTDLKTAEELAPSVARLQRFPNVTLVLGEHRLEDFRNRDYILKAAGVPLDSPYIAEARAHQIPIKMSASWFAELTDVPVVGVTGTRGKSTVTHMLHTILREAGWPVLLGGNVRGVSTLALLDDVQGERIALFELDSWQLQGFGDARISPDIAIFTTLMDDHLSYYAGDRDAYLADKAQIFLHQDATDTLIVGAQCAAHITEVYGDRIAASMIVAGAHDFRADWELAVPGEHNRYAAALATEAARALEIDDAIIQRALAGFGGVPGRLQKVRTVNTVAYYNDTNATTPDATIAALEALNPTGDVYISLILGGADKGLDLDALIAAVQEKAAQVTLLAGSGTERIRDAFPDAPVTTSLADALASARAQVVQGGVVLLSPAFASFGMFQNEYDRGDQYDALVAAL